MSRLIELRKPMEDMTLDELRDHVRNTRKDRRLIKERPAAKKAVRKTADKAKTKLSKMLDGLTPEQLAKLLGDADASEGNPT